MVKSLIVCFLISSVNAEIIEVDVTAEVKETKFYYFMGDGPNDTYRPSVIGKLTKAGFNFKIIAESDPLFETHPIPEVPTIFVVVNGEITVNMDASCPIDKIIEILTPYKRQPPIQKIEETRLYYFTNGSNKCRRQLIVIRILKASGFNFEIITENDPRAKEYKVTMYPTIIIVTSDKVIRLEGLQPLRKLIRVIIENRKETKAPGTQLLYFTSKKCGGCVKQTPIIRTLQADGFNFRILEMNQRNTMFEKYKVTSVPTIIIIHRRGVMRLEGFQPLGKLLLLLIPDMRN